MQFEFATATRIVFGAGTLKQIASITTDLGRRPLIVTGRDPQRADLLLSLLHSAGMKAATFAVEGEPTISTIENGLAAVKSHGADHVIGFGGGSALDAGKAIAIMATNAGGVLDYLEVIGGGKVFSRPSLPFVAIPTTSGTGAEVTRNAVIGSPEHHAKASLRSPHMFPRVALVDPELTFRLSPGITAASGMDALTQLIEPYVCQRANPMTDAICRDGIPRVARSLTRAVTNGTCASAREDMALASMFGGLALSNAGLGAVHGFANPIGGMFPAPHGAICAALLPHVMRANLRALRDRATTSATQARYTEVATMLTGDTRASADDGAAWVEALVSGLQIPRLGAYGITTNNIPEIVEKSQKASSMKANPVQLKPEELAEILQQAI